MDALTHRELRNNSGEVLRRVAAGESMLITNNGQPVAVVGPVGRSVLEELAARGQLRRATRRVSALREISRKTASSDSSDLLHDSRGKW